MDKTQVVKILNNPLAIDYSGLESIIAASELRGGDIFSQTRESKQVQSIAVIPIYGALSHRSQGIYSWLFGRTATYQAVRDQFRTAMADDSIDGVVFEIDSPGGEAAGCFDLVDEIYNARDAKPIIAIANETALSGAYAIASAADKVYLSRTAQVGSIGVIALHIDQSEADQKQGLKYTPIFAGERKNDFSPHEPLSKEAYVVGKKEVDQIYDLFVQTVARNRNVSEKAIRETEAAKYSGEDAVNIGLADGVRSFDQAINNILNPGESIMSFLSELQSLLKNKPEDEVQTAMAEIGFVPKSTMKSDLEKMRISTIGDTQEILSLCKLAGVTDIGFAVSLVSDGISIKQAKEKILQAKADDSDQNEIFSTVGAISTGEVNPLIADAKRRARKENK